MFPFVEEINEITWRGVQTGLLMNLTGNFWIAAIICSISFAFAHFNQGWKSSSIIFFFAMGFSSLVWLSGSLYVAMAVHMVYDLIAGFTYGKLGKEFGYSPQPTEPPESGDTPGPAGSADVSSAGASKARSVFPSA